MKNTYYLIRHGENIHQIKHKALSYPAKDSKRVYLTEKGKREVRKSLKKLGKTKIDLIYSSDFYRARQTAEMAAKKLRINKISFDKRLRDTNVGIFHGKKKEDYLRFMGYKKRKFSTKVPKGESWSDIKKRVGYFLKDMGKRYKRKKILVVGHGDPLWIMDGLIKGKTEKQMLYTLFVKKDYFKTGELKKVN